MELISVIMPCFNVERFIGDAINSVLAQSYQHWELLIVNDGSTDRTKEIILQFEDSRIRYFEHPNNGVSAARNIGLMHMQGSFFCFLDADDILPENSLMSRLRKFQENERLTFVDGVVVCFLESMRIIDRIYRPGFAGSPLRNLFFLNGKCFVCPSWMIRRDFDKIYSMKEGLSHGEDMLFFMELARGGKIYDFVGEEVLYYRQHPHSAMNDLSGLEESYGKIYETLSKWEEFTLFYRIIFKWRTKKSMFLAYLRRMEIKRSLSVLLK